MSWTSYNTLLIGNESVDALNGCVGCGGCDKCPCTIECQLIKAICNRINFLIKENNIGNCPPSIYAKPYDFFNLSNYMDKIDYFLKDKCDNCENCENCDYVSLCKFIDKASVDAYKVFKDMNTKFNAKPWF